MPALRTMLKAEVSTPDTPDTPGYFEAVISTIGGSDRYGDTFAPGSYDDTIAAWAQSDHPMPVVWSHRYEDPANFIGEWISLAIVDNKLLAKGVLDLTLTRAQEVYGLMKRGIIREFSVGGEVEEYRIIEDDEDYWYGLYIEKFALWEAGPCFKGVNQNTQLIAVKAAEWSTPLAHRFKASSDGSGTMEPNAPKAQEPQEPTPPEVEEPAVEPEPQEPEPQDQDSEQGPEVILALLSVAHLPEKEDPSHES